MLLDILIKRAYDYAWCSGSNYIRRNILINYAASSDDDVVSDSDARQYDCPTSDKTILADDNRSIYDSFRILAWKIADDTSRSVVCDKSTIKRNRRVVTYIDKIRFRPEVCLSGYPNILSQVRTSIL